MNDTSDAEFLAELLTADALPKLDDDELNRLQALLQRDCANMARLRKAKREERRIGKPPQWLAEKRQLEAILLYNQRRRKTATPAGEQPSEAVAGPPMARKKRRGRPTDTDAKQDRRVWEAWQTGHHRTHEELAAAMGLPTREVKLAIDRERKRREKRRNN